MTIFTAMKLVTLTMILGMFLASLGIGPLGAETMSEHSVGSMHAQMADPSSDSEPCDRMDMAGCPMAVSHCGIAYFEPASVPVSVFSNGVADWHARKDVRDGRSHPPEDPPPIFLI